MTAQLDKITRADAVYHMTLVSKNPKTGRIGVSMTSRESCPDACIFKNSGCYAENGPVSWSWAPMKQNLSLAQFCAQILCLPTNKVWRHNSAGDLPGSKNRLRIRDLHKIVVANRRAQARGFTYTHKPLARKTERDAVKKANDSGFTINLSANTPAHADRLAGLEIGPVVLAVPRKPIKTKTYTPDGRTIIDCPATYSKAQCDTCRLCAVPTRKTIIAFPVHGIQSAKAVGAIDRAMASE